MKIHRLPVLAALCALLLVGGAIRAGSISIGLPGDGTTVVTLPDGVVVLDTVAVKKRVENLKGVTYAAAIVIDDEKLQLEGKIDSGHLKDGELELKSSARLTSKFSTEGPDYELTLLPGKVEVEIKKSVLNEFRGRIPFQAGFTLKETEATVEGSIDAKYEEDDSSFKGIMLLDEPLALTVGPALLELGSSLEFQANPTLGFTALPEDDVVVVVAFVSGEDRQPLVIGCLWNSDSTCLSGDGADHSSRGELTDTAEVVAGDVTIRLLEGETVEVDIEESELIDLRLDGVRFEAEAVVDGKKRVVKGKIKDSSYDPDSESITLVAKEFVDLGVKKIEIKIEAPEDPPSTKE